MFRISMQIIYIQANRLYSTFKHFILFRQQMRFTCAMWSPRICHLRGNGYQSNSLSSHYAVKV